MRRRIIRKFADRQSNKQRKREWWGERRRIRKFADREQTDNQTKNSSKTEATLILCESSGERANNRGEYYKRGGWGEEKLENLQRTHNQTNRQFKNWGHSNPLWIVGGAGQYPPHLPSLHKLVFIHKKDRIYRLTEETVINNRGQ